jgi:antitoxin (DNA-binding transcriptional repressor) of toxin-antitoxin stability system
MKTLELTKASAPNIEQGQTIILTVGGRPVAALLPMAEDIDHLAEYERVFDREESVTLTLAGKPVAVVRLLVPMVPIEDENADIESVALSVNPKFLNLIERVRKHQESEGGIPSNEMRRKLGMK